MSSQNFLKIGDAAKFLGISKTTLRRWEDEGRIVSYRHVFNNYRMYDVDDINRLSTKLQIIVCKAED